jgi:hypothetical protein
MATLSNKIKLKAPLLCNDVYENISFSGGCDGEVSMWKIDQSNASTIGILNDLF